MKAKRKAIRAGVAFALLGAFSAVPALGQNQTVNTAGPRHGSQASRFHVSLPRRLHR